jgi:hypothetical protein
LSQAVNNFIEVKKFLLLAFVGFNNGRSSDYLTMLSVLRLNSIDDRMINEFRTVGKMRIHRGSQIIRRKPTPVPLYTTNPRCSDLGLNPGHCDGKPVANCLSYDTACGACYGTDSC